jgi:hypothetical protein
MHRDQILLALRHWYKRQTESGAESSFRFGLVGGPNQRTLFASYPALAEPEPADARPPQRKRDKGKKDKGKQRAIGNLDGLLTISQTDSRFPDSLPQGPSPKHNPVPTHVSIPPSPSPISDLVQVNLGQVMRLRDLGYNVYGPINGPNDGLPEYQVPRAWLDRLGREIMTSDALNPGPSSNTGRPYPRPRPVHKPRDLANNSATAEPGIDPILLMGGHPEGLVSTENIPRTSSNPFSISEPHPSLRASPSQLMDNQNQIDKSPIGQQSTCNTQPGPSSHTSNALAVTRQDPSPTPSPTPEHSQLLGKRSQVDRSPQKQRSTQKNTRRKVVRDDDLAIQEARQLLNCTARTRPRTRSGRKRG